MQYSSSRPETLRYSDLSSGGSGDDVNYSGRESSSKRVTISDRRRSRSRDNPLQRLESYNIHLARENDLLKEQLRLKEEALRLHGLNLMSDVIHLLDQHHIECDQHRPIDLTTDTVYRDQSAYGDGSRRRGSRIINSPYERDLEGEHELLADLARGDNIRERQYGECRQQSPSMDSTELEDILERSCSAKKLSKKIKPKPKNTNTPLRRAPSRVRGKSASRKSKSANCNVNARHMSPDISYNKQDIDSGTDSDSLSLVTADDMNSSYFPTHHHAKMAACRTSLVKEYLAQSGREKRKEVRKQDLLSHWKECEHRNLHIPPANPDAQVQNKRPSTKEDQRKLLSKADLNQTYTVKKGGNKTPHTTCSQAPPRVMYAGKFKPKPPNPKFTKRSSSTTPPMVIDAVKAPVHKPVPSTKSSSKKPAIATSPQAGPIRVIPAVCVEELNMAPTDLNKISLLESNNNRVLGEIAFQLDKRILSFVLNGKFNKDCKYKSFYGYNVVNLQQRIIERETGEMKEVMLDRYTFLMRTLHSIGYAFPHHGNFAATLVNKYGVMKQSKADAKNIVISVHDEGLIRELARRYATPLEINDLLILLQCLAVMSADDGHPLFIW